MPSLETGFAPLNTDGFEYDFVISYAGEDDRVAKDLYRHLTEARAKVFYAGDKKAELLGVDLFEYLPEIFSRKGRFCLPLISEHYTRKFWPKYEWRSALQRVLEDVDAQYILPIRLDDTELPGLHSSVVYLDIEDGVENIAQTVLEKLLALDPLQSVIPDNWKIMPLSILSGEDTGKHWQIHIVETTDHTPKADLHLYQRTIVTKHGGRRVGTKIKVPVLKYLFQRSSPVILLLTHATSKTHYWIWLHEALQEAPPDWENRKEIQVYVSTSKLLTDDIEAIEKHTAWIYHRNLLQRRVETEHHPAFNFGFQSFSDSKYGISVYPKHSKALEQNPIDFSLALSPESQAELQRAVSQGEPASLDGQISITGLPDWLVSDTSTKASLQIFPLVPDIQSHVQIQCLDEADNLLLNLSFVELKLVQMGTDLLRWQGKVARQPVIITITLDRPTETANVNLTIDRQTRNIVQLNWYLDALEALSKTQKFTITNLETELSTSITEALDYTILNPLPDPIRRFIKALAMVAQAIGIKFLMPDGFGDEALETAEMLAEIVKTGKTSKISGIPEEILKSGHPPVLIGDSPVSEVREMMKILDEQGEIYIPIPSEIKFKVFGHQIDLGPAQYLFCGVDFHDKDALQEVLCQGAPDEAKRIRIHLLLNTEKSYTQFVNWGNSED